MVYKIQESECMQQYLATIDRVVFKTSDWVKATRFGFITSLFVVSWLYACCAQLSIWLPFGLVPLYLNPLPLFLLTFAWGRPAIYAFALYLAQSAVGAPFFAGGMGGMARLLGPTGGYLLGMLLAAIFLDMVRNYQKQSRMLFVGKVYLANGIVFCCGLAQLAFFVPSTQLLAVGLYPFLLGDFVIKAGLICLLSR